MRCIGNCISTSPPRSKCQDGWAGRKWWKGKKQEWAWKDAGCRAGLTLTRRAESKEDSNSQDHTAGMRSLGAAANHKGVSRWAAVAQLPYLHCGQPRVRTPQEKQNLGVHTALDLKGQLTVLYTGTSPCPWLWLWRQQSVIMRTWTQQLSRFLHEKVESS